MSLKSDWENVRDNILFLIENILLFLLIPVFALLNIKWAKYEANMKKRRGKQ